MYLLDLDTCTWTQQATTCPKPVDKPGLRSLHMSTVR